jgi:hypothetical protein
MEAKAYSGIGREPIHTVSREDVLGFFSEIGDQFLLFKKPSLVGIQLLRDWEFTSTEECERIVGESFFQLARLHEITPLKQCGIFRNDGAEFPRIQRVGELAEQILVSYEKNHPQDPRLPYFQSLIKKSYEESLFLTGFTPSKEGYSLQKAIYAGSSLFVDEQNYLPILCGQLLYNKNSLKVVDLRLNYCEYAEKFTNQGLSKLLKTLESLENMEVLNLLEVKLKPEHCESILCLVAQHPKLKCVFLTKGLINEGFLEKMLAERKITIELGNEVPKKVDPEWAAMIQRLRKQDREEKSDFFN